MISLAMKDCALRSFVHMSQESCRQQSCCKDFGESANRDLLYGSLNRPSALRLPLKSRAIVVASVGWFARWSTQMSTGTFLPRPKVSSKEKLAEALEAARFQELSEYRAQSLVPCWWDDVRGLYLGTITNLRRQATKRPAWPKALCSSSVRQNYSCLKRRVLKQRMLF